MLCYHVDENDQQNHELVIALVIFFLFLVSADFKIEIIHVIYADNTGMFRKTLFT